MTNVDIFGTCYTRELFNTTKEYNVNTYLMQQSIFSMFAEPLHVDIENVKSHDNFNFKNRMLYYEFNKLAILKLLENPSEYLVLDLTDAARDILIFNDIKLISTSDVKLTLDFLKSSGKHIDFISFDVRNYTDDEISDYLIKFINILLQKYDSEKVILNRVQMQNVFYVDSIKKYINDNFIYSRWDFIKRLEKIFLEILPDCKILYSDQEPLLDINHRFGGPHPMHFERIYYEYRMKLLDCIINNNLSSEEINEWYEDEYNKNIEIIKKKLMCS